MATLLGRNLLLLADQIPGKSSHSSSLKPHHPAACLSLSPQRIQGPPSLKQYPNLHEQLPALMRKEMSRELAAVESEMVSITDYYRLLYSRFSRIVILQ